MEQFDRYAPKSPNIEIFCGEGDFQRIIEKLAEYETAEEDGRLVVLPCKIGDVIYVIDEAECLSIRKTTIEGITINERGICFMIPTKKANMSFGYYNSDFDKAVFFSIEEAEKALKEIENKI